MGYKIAIIKDKLAQSLEIWSQKELQQTNVQDTGWRWEALTPVLQVLPHSLECLKAPVNTGHV